MNSNFKKKTIIILLLIIAFIAGNNAQAQGGGQQGSPPIPDSTQIKKMVTELSTELMLSNEQKSQVSKMYFAHFEKVTVLSKKRIINENKRIEMDKLKNQFQLDVNSVLNNEQKKKYAEYLKTHNSKPKRPPRPKR